MHPGAVTTWRNFRKVWHLHYVLFKKPVPECLHVRATQRGLSYKRIADWGVHLVKSFTNPAISKIYIYVEERNMQNLEVAPLPSTV